MIKSVIAQDNIICFYQH